MNTNVSNSARAILPLTYTIKHETWKSNILVPKMLQHTEAIPLPEESEEEATPTPSPEEEIVEEVPEKEEVDNSAADPEMDSTEILDDTQEDQSNEVGEQVGDGDDDDDDEDITRLIEKISIKVRSMDDAVLKSYITFMRSAADHLEIERGHTMCFPKYTEKRTLISSPFIVKKHQQKYEVRTYGRGLEVKNLTGETADIYLEYIQRNIPEGVSMSVETTEIEAYPDYMFTIPEES